MKFRNLMLSMIAASAMMIAASCGSDDDDEATPDHNVPGSIDAVYQGKYALQATAMGQTLTAINDKDGVKISYASNSTLYVTLPATELQEMKSAFPSATVEVEFSINQDGTITLKETAFETAPDAAGKTCKGTLGGLVDNDKLTLTGTESYGAMPVVCSIIFPYTGQ